MAVSVSATDEQALSSPAGDLQPHSREAGMRIAVIDRDSGFIQVLGKRLERLGMEHRIIAGPAPVEAVAAMRLSALVVDLAVLGGQAWGWLERLCACQPDLGVVICTGPSTVAQRVRGLRLGADDWVTKPTHPEEVIARIESVTRRRRRTSGKLVAKPVMAGEVEVRPDRFQAFVAGRSLDLTRREFELIQLLAGAEGRVMEREEIYSRLWGYAMVRGDRSVDVFVRKLRQKLEKASPTWRYIHTHFGIGYRFAAEPHEGAGDEQPDAIADPAAASPGGATAAGSGSSDVARGLAGDQRELGGSEEEDELAACTV
ncbi:MAG TPA: response regulator transcription factor [Solirubrobacteraceae bacterium]